MRTKQVGDIGEKLAINHLKFKGYKILATNWYCRAGEIDIVAQRCDCLVFVEVKYRRSSSRGWAYQAFDYKKKFHIKRTVSYFLKKYNLYKYNYRLDLICIDGIEISHYENVSV